MIAEGLAPPEARELCLGLELVPLGLPDFQLLPEPSKWVPKDFPRPSFGKKRPQRGPLIYALLIDSFLFDVADPPPAVAIEIVDTRTWTRAGGFSLGRFAAMSLAVSPDGRRIYVLDLGQQVHVVTAAGASIGTVSLPEYASDFVLDSAGTTLYVSAETTLLAVDTATLSVTRTRSVWASGQTIAVPPVGSSSVALSPDGSTLAAVHVDGRLHILDVATLTPLAVAITDPSGPPGCVIKPNAVVVSDRGRAVLWDSWCDRFYEVVLFNGQQDHGATARMGRDAGGSWNYNDSIVYSAANGRAYAVKESKEVATKVVGLGHISRSLIGGFTGDPFVPVMAPGGLKLWVAVNRWPAANTIDEIDTISSTVTRDRYTFSGPGMIVRSAVAL
jgi:DNA-binding beta-propeller fold protein YncE